MDEVDGEGAPGLDEEEGADPHGVDTIEIRVDTIEIRYSEGAPGLDEVEGETSRLPESANASEHQHQILPESANASEHQHQILPESANASEHQHQILFWRHWKQILVIGLDSGSLLGVGVAYRMPRRVSLGSASYISAIQSSALAGLAPNGSGMLSSFGAAEDGTIASVRYPVGEASISCQLCREL